MQSQLRICSLIVSVVATLFCGASSSELDGTIASYVARKKRPVSPYDHVVLVALDATIEARNSL
jgi:hypothetical protein